MRVEMDLNVPARFDPKKNQVAKDWKVWKKQFLTYLRLSVGYTTLSEEKKAYLLQNLMGPKAVEAMENMTFENPHDREDMNILLSKFDEVFDPLPNEIEERYKFFSRRIERNETIDNYVKDLQKLANKCNFGNQKEKFIIDMLIRTMDKHLRQMTFNKEGIRLEDMIESIKQDTVNNMRMKKLSENMTKDFKLNKKKDANVEKNASDEVKSCPRCNVRHQPGPCQVKDNSNEQTKRICIKCGTNHPYKQCPEFHNTCCKCHEKGHSAAQCEILKAARNKKRLSNEQSHARSSSHNRKGISHSSLAPSEQMSRPTHLSHGYSNATPAPSNDAPPSYFQSEAETRNRLYPSLVDPQNDRRVYHQASYCQSCKNNPLATCFVCKRSSTNVGRANVVKEESFKKVERTYVSPSSTKATNEKRCSNEQSITGSSSQASYCQSCKNNPLVTCFVCKRSSTNVGRANVVKEESFKKVERTYVSPSSTKATNEKRCSNEQSIADSSSQASYCQSCKNNPLATCFVCKRSNTNVGRANVVKEESFKKVERTYVSPSSTKATNEKRCSNEQSIAGSSSQASYCQSCKNNPLATCFVCKRSSTNVGRANVLGEESFVKVERTYISQYHSPAPAPAQTSQIKNQPYLPSYGSYNNTKKKNDACCIS